MAKKDSRKVYVAILAVALSSFVADRLFFGEGGTTPQQASASSGDVPIVDALVLEAIADTVSQSEQLTLAQRLKSLEGDFGLDITEFRDAFMPSDSWLGKGPDSEGFAPDTLGSEFGRIHQITSILYLGDGKGSVILDDQYVSVGQVFDGFTLVDLTDRTAVFQSGTETVELELVSGP